MNAFDAWDDRRFEGREAWIQALRDLLAAPGSLVAMYSDDYAEWPLNERAVIDALEAWAVARSQPCVRMLARSFDGLMQRCPRFVDWRTRFAHLIECRELGDTEPPRSECLLTREVGVLALPGENFRRAVGCSGARLQGLLRGFDEGWAQGTPGFALRPLGL
jgi:hypothetical protein